MKRLFSVLAIALILTMMLWGTANSLGAPEKLREVNWDHPWGGDHQNEDFPLSVADPKDPIPDIKTASSFNSWITTWFYYSIYYLDILPKSDITVDVTEDTNTNNDATTYNYTGSGK